jgi:hypothetical protein
MPMAVMASRRMATQRATSMPAKGMYSVETPSVPEPSANTPSPRLMSRPGLWPMARRIAPSMASSAPVARSTAIEPPTIKRKKMMTWASDSARGTAVNNTQGGSQTRSATTV